MNNATLIYNPVAGGRPRRREREILRAAAILESAGIRARLAPTSGPQTATALARAAVSQGHRLILVCGGDGTVNEVINGLALSGAAPRPIGDEVTLGVLPGGTANVLAREMRLPLHILKAARELPRWEPRRIVLGLVTWPSETDAPNQFSNRRYFLSVAGVGFDAYVIQHLAPGAARSLGVIAYIAEALRQIFSYSFPALTCQVENQEFQATFAIVQRTSFYAGWLRPAPQASIFNDSFRLCLFESRHRARYAVYAAAMFAGRHLRLHDVRLVECRNFVCAAANSLPPILFELDGELVGKLPARFEIVPDALTLLAPRGENRKSADEPRVGWPVQELND